MFNAGLRYEVVTPQFVTGNHLANFDPDSNTISSTRWVLASGAQIISTDYPASEQAASGYKVELPGNAVARCNPVLLPKTCVDSGLVSDR